MITTAILITALLALPAVGLATWAWYAMAGIESQLQTLSGFEGLHFEIGPQAAITSKGSTWPTPG